MPRRFLCLSLVIFFKLKKKKGLVLKRRFYSSRATQDSIYSIIAVPDHIMNYLPGTVCIFLHIMV